VTQTTGITAAKGTTQLLALTYTYPLANSGTCVSPSGGNNGIW